MKRTVPLVAVNVGLLSYLFHRDRMSHRVAVGAAVVQAVAASVLAALLTRDR